jgi:hypothetical protein
VEVEGTVRLDPAQVRAWAQIPKRTGLWALAPEPIVARLERRAWINTVFIRKRFPNTLVIEVVERVPTAVAQTERGAVLIDAEGAVLEPTRLDTGFPLVVGASLKRPEGLAVAADLLAGLHAVDRIPGRRRGGRRDRRARPHRAAPGRLSGAFWGGGLRGEVAPVSGDPRRCGRAGARGPIGGCPFSRPRGGHGRLTIRGARRMRWAED